MRPPILRLHEDDLIVDSFAGGGGASLGIEWALGRSPDVAINHDAEAIAMHRANHQAGHAILLARLKPEDQKRAISTEAQQYVKQQALFTEEYSIGEEEPERNGNRYAGLKARSVRELQAWIDEHVKFDTAHDADPMLFPDTAEALRAAAAEKSKVIPITREHYVPEDARDGNRVFGPRSWRRADGEMTKVPPHWKAAKSKTCEKSGLGVIMVGEGRGEAFQVCVNRTCEVHFPQQAKKAKTRGTKPAETRHPEESAETKAAREAISSAHDEAIEQINELTLDAAAAATPVEVIRVALLSLNWTIRDYLQKAGIKGDAAAWIKMAKPAQLQRALVYDLLDHGDYDDVAEAFGIDHRRIIKEHEDQARAALKAQTSAPAKGKARKKGGKR